MAADNSAYPIITLAHDIVVITMEKPHPKQAPPDTGKPPAADSNAQMKSSANGCSSCFLWSLKSFLFGFECRWNATFMDYSSHVAPDSKDYGTYVVL